MAKWTPFPQLGEFRYDAESLAAAWPRLHAGDAEPLPREPLLLHAWALFHNGLFEEAVQAGLAAGPAGAAVANKATCIYANYLEQSEPARLELFQQAAQRAEAQAQAEPENASAWYWQAYALGRYSQAVSVARALAQGLGGKVKHALERAIALQPRHADGHVALGAFHAEVIDKVGSLIGSMTYGARKETGMRMFQHALRLDPDSPIVLIEFAKGLVMLEDDAPQAARLYARAAALQPLDAKQRLEVDLACAAAGGAAAGRTG
jgi:tetratricopeptide (TPR) repeat protein